MINKTSHPIKVKVEKNISTKTNHRTTEKNVPSSKITLSIELLKGIISLVFMVLPNQFHTEYHRVTLSHTKTPIPWGFLVVESPKTA